MGIDRIVAVLLTGSMISIALSTPSSATPKQYRAGYAAGVAVGKKIGKMDGSGESGTNSMHTNATCSIETPKSEDFIAVTIAVVVPPTSKLLFKNTRSASQKSSWQGVSDSRTVRIPIIHSFLKILELLL